MEGVSRLLLSLRVCSFLIREQSSYIKPYVDSIDQQVMFAEKSWGSYRVLDVSDRCMTVKVALNPGHGMNYHSYERRDEVLTVIYGSGSIVIDGEERLVSAGDMIDLPIGCMHTVSASSTGFQIIEVQMCEEISVRDKKKWEMK